MNIYSFISDIYIGGDVLDDLRLLRVVLHQVLDALDGVEHGGVVPAVELLADLLQRQVGHAADEIHGDLAGQGDVLGPALAPEGGGLEVVVLADLVDDHVGGGHDVRLVLEHILHRPDHGALVHRVAHQVLIGHDLVHRALDLPDVGGDVLGDELEQELGQLHPHADGLVFDDGHAGLVVGGLNVGQQAPLEAGLQPVLQAEHLLGRAVGGEDDLLFQLVQGVEGMEHLLLGRVPAGDELHVVHQEHVGAPVFLPEFGVAALADGLDQLVGEGVALDVHHLIVRVVVVDGVGDGVQQMGLAQAGLAVDEQGVIALPGIVCHGPGGGVGELVGGAHHEALEGVLLCPGEEAALLGGFQGVHLPLGEDNHVEIGGKQLVQGVLDEWNIAGCDDVPLEPGGAVQDEAVFVQRHGAGVVKPGIDGGGSHIGLHQLNDLRPDLSSRVHAGVLLPARFCPGA